MRPLRERAVLGLVLGAVLAQPAMLEAAPVVVARLEYRAPPGRECPGRFWFDRAVARRVGGAAFEVFADRALDVRIERRGERYQGRIGWADDAAGARTLEHPNCRGLAEALALVAALAIDPLADLSPPDPGAAGPRLSFDAYLGGITEALPTPEDTSDRPAPSRERRRPWLLGGVVRAGLVAGAAPRPTGSLAAGLVFSGAAPISASVELVGELPVAGAAGSGRVFVSALGTTASACWRTGPLAACGLGTVGGTRLEGWGLATARVVWAPLARAGGRLMLLARPSRRSRLGVHLDLSAALVRLEVRDDIDPVVFWTTPAASLQVGLSLGWGRP